MRIFAWVFSMRTFVWVFQMNKKCKEPRGRKKIKSPVYEKFTEFPFIANNDITYVFFVEIKTEYGTLYIYTVKTKVKLSKFNGKLSIILSP